jgi:uncharacterized protein involved in exopolysaccharide biosynthesis
MGERFEANERAREKSQEEFDKRLEKMRLRSEAADRKISDLGNRVFPIFLCRL